MNERDELRLRNMRDAANSARKIARGRTRELLETDEMFNYAILHLVQIIGEAANQVTPETRDRLPNLKWRQMIAMRNRIIHAYDDLDLDIVWNTVINDLPTLISELEAILPPFVDEDVESNPDDV